MHRTIEVTLSAEKTGTILNELEKHPFVIGLNVYRNVSVKPHGDTVVIQVLNKGADDVLKIIRLHGTGTRLSIITSELASISDPLHQKEIDRDSDETIWEEMETGLRHTGRLTRNYLFLMACGSVIASIGFLSEVHVGVIAFVSASIIAPGMEPFAKIPLGLVLKNMDVLRAGLKAAFWGYLLIIIMAGLTFLFLREISDITEAEFLNNKTTIDLLHLKARDFLMSLAATVASIIMYLSYRRNVIAGPLMALVLVPAAAAIGICLVIGEWGNMLLILKRLGVDIVLIIGVGIIIFYAKQKLIHKRKPLR